MRIIFIQIEDKEKSNKCTRTLYEFFFELSARASNILRNDSRKNKFFEIFKLQIFFTRGGQRWRRLPSSKRYDKCRLYRPCRDDKHSRRVLEITHEWNVLHSSCSSGVSWVKLCVFAQEQEFVMYLVCVTLQVRKVWENTGGREKWQTVPGSSCRHQT